MKTLAHRRSSEYRTVRARLKETGKRHVVLVHQQATQACALDLPFFVLADDGHAPLTRFYHQFNRAVAVCVRESWGLFLWERGLANGLIEACQAGGISAWRVEANGDAWAEVVRDGISARAIG